MTAKKNIKPTKAIPLPSAIFGEAANFIKPASEELQLAEKLIDFLERKNPRPAIAFIASAYLAAYLIDTKIKTKTGKMEGLELMNLTILDFLNKNK